MFAQKRAPLLHNILPCVGKDADGSATCYTIIASKHMLAQKRAPLLHKILPCVGKDADGSATCYTIIASTHVCPKEGTAAA